jgi:hypothetical protein
MTEDKMKEIADLLMQANEVIADIPPDVTPINEAEWDARCKQIRETSEHLSRLYEKGRLDS